jgi:hypothetical protein
LVDSELKRLYNTINMKIVTYVYYIGHKVASHLLQGIHVNLDALDKIKHMLKDKNNRVVLLPLNRSHADMIIV